MSLRVETNRAGEIIKKVWRAAAKGETLDDAIGCVLDFKPSGSDIAVVEETWTHPEPRAAYEWTWEWKAPKSGVQSHDCTVTVTPGRPRLVVSKLVGDKGQPRNPVAHAARADVTTIEIKGTVLAYDRAAARPPSPHYTESDTLMRARFLENDRFDPLEPAIHDVKEGLYIMKYQEVWWSFDGNVPTANHEGGHNVIAIKSAPGARI